MAELRRLGMRKGNERSKIFRYFPARKDDPLWRVYKSSTLRESIVQTRTSVVCAHPQPLAADLSLNFRFIVSVQTFRERPIFVGGYAAKTNTHKQE